MSKKEEFKEFVKKNPKLVKYVRNGEGSWQKFYEIYDLYGENEDAWKEYLGIAATTATVGAIDALSWLKNINLDSVQSGVANIQKMLGMVQELTNKEEKPNQEYKPRPVYKHFED